MTRAEVLEQLSRAMRERTMLRVSRRYDETRIDGYVLDIGPRFFLMAILSDGVWLDGFEALRLADVTELEAHRAAGFFEAALEKRGQRVEPPALDLSSLEALLQTAAAAFPLLTLSHERANPDSCWIGRLVQIDRSSLLLLEIDPDAIWEEEPHRHRLGDITRVGLGGSYEEALYLVGGDPPDRPFAAGRFRLH